MSEVLVAYFSASGVTKRMAERISTMLDADLFEIEPSVLYTKADLNWLNRKSRSSVEMKDRSSRPEIAKKTDISDYSTSFIGFPIWWYREPSIIDTFLEQYDFKGKTIVPFATSGGSGFGKTAENLRVLTPGANVLEGKRFKASVKDEVLKTWIDEMLK